MRLTRVASAALIACAISAAEPPTKPLIPRDYTAQPTSSISVANAGDAKLISKVTLFVSEDGGRTWHKSQDVPVAPDATKVPGITFTAPTDGTFGLWTTATARTGSSDAEPTAGSTPKCELVVDRIAPALEQLEATLGEMSNGSASLSISWKINEPNLGATPVSLEVSTDQGKTFVVRHSGAAEGTTAVPVAAAGATEIQVRVIARDLAGNVLTSPARAVGLPIAVKTTDPDAKLAAAVADLPKPDELGVSARGGAPIVVAGADSPLAGTGSAATGLKPAESTKVPDPDVISGKDVEGKFARAANQQGPDGRPGAPTNETQPAVPRGTVPDASLPFLVGFAAADALIAAAKAEQQGDAEAALAQYLRLHRSSVAKDAITNELMLLNGFGDDKTILGIVTALPPELLTDVARLHAARASMRQGRNGDAAAWAARVRISAPEAREATLILGKALKAQGRVAEGKRLFEKLLSTDDEFAAQARAELAP